MGVALSLKESVDSAHWVVAMCLVNRTKLRRRRRVGDCPGELGTLHVLHGWSGRLMTLVEHAPLAAGVGLLLLHLV